MFIFLYFFIHQVWRLCRDNVHAILSYALDGQNNFHKRVFNFIDPGYLVRNMRQTSRPMNSKVELHYRHQPRGIISNLQPFIVHQKPSSKKQYLWKGLPEGYKKSCLFLVSVKYTSRFPQRGILHYSCSNIFRLNHATLDFINPC